MAYLNQFQYTYEKDTVRVFCQLTVGAAGAVTSALGGGVVGATKQVADGQYEVEFTRKYSKFLNLVATSVKATATTVARVQALETPASYQADIKADKTLTIQCLDFAGAAVNPASGEIILLEFCFRKSDVQLAAWGN